MNLWDARGLLPAMAVLIGSGLTLAFPSTSSAEAAAINSHPELSAAAASSKIKGCSSKWTPVPLSSPKGLLYAVTVGSNSDAWAGGNSTSLTGPLSEHWNGTTWALVSGPPDAPTNAELKGLAEVGPSDVWGVGDGGPGGTYIQHWNGSAWSMAMPPPTGRNSALLAVSAVASSDVWAVGFLESPLNTFHSLVEHWDGRAWSIVPLSDPPTTGVFLYGVSAVASNDVWAVGYYDAPGEARPLVEHWNGSAWTISLSTGVGALSSVSAASASDVWAVGASGSSRQAIAVHWNGRKWQFSSMPSTGATFMYGVRELSHSNVWAVGVDFPAGGDRNRLIEHYNGHSWTVVQNDPGFVGSAVGGSRAELWVVGYDTSNAAAIEQACHL